MKSASRSLMLASLCLLVAGIATPALAKRTSIDILRVDAYIEETMRRFPIPGLSVAIVQADQILYAKGYGTANRQGDPVAPQTPFLVGSLTKTFTALAAHQLAQAGKLDLDVPVQKYIPEFRLADPQAAAEITVRQLLDHTSGISNLEGNKPYLLSPNATFQSALATLAQYRPEYEAGQHYEYSNANYALLSEVVARASGEPYAAYVQKNILDPLRMTHSSLADYHSVQGSATYNLFAYGFSFPYDQQLGPVLVGAGGLSATAEDMAHYMIAFFNRGLYQGQAVLPAQGPGYYDSSWNWHAGQVPQYANDTFCGAHISTNACMQLWHVPRVGIMVLMNTRLDSPIRGVTAADIADDVARMVMGQSVEVRSNAGFYGRWILFDALIVFAVASIVWQTARLKGWMQQYGAATPGKRHAAQLVAGLDIVIGAAALLVPSSIGTNWLVALSLLPNVTVPLLIMGVGHCALGLFKVAAMMPWRVQATAD